ncbi:hypothetical protein EMIT0P44_330047 [Pseudomonas sp. IT-P44]
MCSTGGNLLSRDNNFKLSINTLVNAQHSLCQKTEQPIIPGWRRNLIPRPMKVDTGIG